MLKTYSMDFRTPSVICLAGLMLFVPQFLYATTTCSPPDFPKGGSYKPKKAAYQVGENITYFCTDSKLISKSEGLATCLSKGSWTELMHFCSKAIPITNVTASSRVHNKESALFDKNFATCFQTRNGTDEFIEVTLERPASIYGVSLNIPRRSKGSFQIKLAEEGKTAPLELIDCQDFDAVQYHDIYTRFLCSDTTVKAKFIIIKVAPGTSSSIWLCEIEAVEKEDVWCKTYPENSLLHSQLEVSRSRAILVCNEGFKEKDNKTVYATCVNDTWHYFDSECIGFCSKETSYHKGHNLTWPGTFVGKSTKSDKICITAGGIDLERNCEEDFYMGAHWSAVEEDCVEVQSHPSLILHKLAKAIFKTNEITG